METTCINHPTNEPFIEIREWQMEFCNNNKVQAALLSFFEYWHNIKLEMSIKNKKSNEIAKRHHDMDNKQDSSLLQFHTEKELENGIMLIGKKSKISKALIQLEKDGVIIITKNPNQRYKFDNTRYFLFQPEIINDWLNTNYQKETENGK